MKKDWLTILILTATVILAIIAVVTAMRLYQIGKEPVAPTAPKPAPAVTIPTSEPTPVPECALEFDIMGTTPTPGTVTPTPTLTVTPTPAAAPTSTPTATPAAEATVTPTPILLPEVGTVFPTWTIGLAGATLLLFGLLFAF